jgi:UDP-N-acetylglucosamine acyltransferase
MLIHPTAIVSSKAELDDSVEIGPYALIEDHVTIGAGTRVMAHAHLSGHTTLGRDNVVHIGAVLGHEPQDLKFDRNCRSYLRIGDRNVFREYCTVHRGTEPDSATVLGNDNYLMCQSHVGHNCVIGNQVIICNCALVAGHVHISDRVFISGGVVIHQFVHIGRLVMLSGNSAVSMDVPPFVTTAERNAVHTLNVVGLRRAQIAPAAQSEIRKLFRLFYRDGLSISVALKKATTDCGFTSPEAQEFLDFVRQSPNGICPPP